MSWRIDAGDMTNDNMTFERDMEQKTTKQRRKPTMKTSYINVNRGKKGYRDKYRKGVENAMKEFRKTLGKPEDYEFNQQEWKQFFKTFLIPLDKDSERKMIDLFIDNRDELNHLLILHNTKASENMAEVYFKKYQKESPNSWYDLDDFKQYALEGLAIAAGKFEPERGNRFLTFATWWMLNRVMKPYNDKGAMDPHVSINAPVNAKDPDNSTTLEEVIGPDTLAAGWRYPGSDESSVNPIAAMEHKNSDENYALYSDMKKIKLSALESMDKNKAKAMMDYLVGVVEKNSNSYDNKQIFLYLFRKIFTKCYAMFPDPKSKVNTYLSEAPKSKAELLKRLNMDESQYLDTMRKLTRGSTYDGI